MALQRTGLGWLTRRLLKKWLAGREWLIFPLLLIYWLSPVDLMPFIPIDDLILTVFGLLLYRSLRKRPDSTSSDVIDVRGKVLK